MVLLKFNLPHIWILAGEETHLLTDRGIKTGDKKLPVGTQIVLGKQGELSQNSKYKKYI